MGRVFSYDEIEQGRIPTQDQFELAKNLFCELSSNYVNQGIFSGAFIFGSVAVNMCGIRSDFDAIISLEDSVPTAIGNAQYMISHIKSATKDSIPLGIEACTKRSIQAGRNTASRFFGKHLTSPDRIVIGIDPASYWQFDQNRPAKDIFQDYLNHKRRRLSKTYTNTEACDVSDGGLQRLLELPIAIGRLAVNIAEETSDSIQVNEPILRSVDKESVTSMTRSLLRSNNMTTDYFDALIEANDTYDFILDEALRHRIGRSSYNGELAVIQAYAPYAIDWIDDLQEKFVPNIKNNLPKLPEITD